MSGYLARRSIGLVPTVIGIVTIVFLMLRFIPGDPAAFIAGENASADALAVIRAKLGLNDSITSQYLHYWMHLLRFDLGRSILTGIPVTETIQRAIPITLVIAVSSTVLGTLLGVPIGTFAAYARSRGKLAADHGLTGFAMAIDTMPIFWVALVFILLFSLKLHLVPVSGPVHWNDPVLVLKRFALPVIVLGLGQISSVARVTRTAVLDSLGDDYVRTARALGTPELAVLFRHALRNSALPIVTITGMSLGRQFGGTVIMETTFSLPGMGTVLIQGINGRDYPVVQGVILVFASRRSARDSCWTDSRTCCLRVPRTPGPSANRTESRRTRRWRTPRQPPRRPRSRPTTSDDRGIGARTPPRRTRRCLPR
jgi:ABC-type dipeptide/oligopeptide/nickel transport system permease component